MVVRTGARSAVAGSRTAAATSSGNADPSAETAPTAPCASPSGISDSGPTKMSSPSTRYGANRSQGTSDTLRPRKFGASFGRSSGYWSVTFFRKMCLKVSTIPRAISGR